MQIFVRPIVSPGEVFAILIGVGHPPVFCKNLFLQVGDPKGVHQGYHEMTYTKFGRGRSFCKNEVGGGGRARGGYFPVFRIYQIESFVFLSFYFLIFHGVSIVLRKQTL